MRSLISITSELRTLRRAHRVSSGKAHATLTKRIGDLERAKARKEYSLNVDQWFKNLNT
jgi:hypothetical protein